MKRTEAISVGDLLKAMIESEGDSDAFDRQKVSFLWSEIVGPTINRATTRRYVEGTTLHVYLSSAPLKAELAYNINALINRLNEAVGRKIITKIAIH